MIIVHKIWSILDQIGNKTCDVQKVSKFYVEKRYERKRLERIIVVYLLHSNVYFTEQNIMQRGDPTELNFESIEMHK